MRTIIGLPRPAPHLPPRALFLRQHLAAVAHGERSVRPVSVIARPFPRFTPVLQVE